MSISIAVINSSPEVRKGLIFIPDTHGFAFIMASDENIAEVKFKLTYIHVRIAFIIFVKISAT